MKEAHRRAHVVIWLVLAPALALGLALALLSRPSEPQNAELPDVLTAEQP